MSANSFGARSSLPLPAGGEVELYRLDALSGVADVGRLPYSIKVLLENLLRHEDGRLARPEHVEALARGEGTGQVEIPFFPERILMQDFTGVPAVVDLATMRDAMESLGGDPNRIEPLVPIDLIIDHSIAADVAGRPGAFRRNAELEFDRNRERYELLRWAQGAFESLRVVPPNTGICHQVNLEYLAHVVTRRDGTAFPDTLVGTDSHTPMVNGLGVVGWGVGGIEAEAAALGQPISMLIPEVVGFRLVGEMPEGSTATDLVLTVTHMLRQHGVVGRFVEFFGPGVSRVPLENRATIGNMSPEYGSTITIFPVDDETLRYLRMTGRSAELIELVEAYAKEQGLWHDPGAEPVYAERLELDLSQVEPSLAGPSRPQDHVKLREAKHAFRAALATYLGEAGLRGGEDRSPGVPGQRLPEGLMADGESEGESAEVASALSFPASDPPASYPKDNPGHDPERPLEADQEAEKPTGVPVTTAEGETFELDHGDVVIAAITSCTNTSNPSVMLAAGLLAKKAVERGLESKPWVKTSLAPGSKVVMDYYERAGLIPYLEKLGFHLVGYGCTTCIGNSGPLAPEISEAVERGKLSVASVLSGNRNFEGRINPDVRMNFLASPPLVVAYALAGTMDLDLYEEPLGEDPEGRPVHLRDLWPSTEEIERAIEEAVDAEMFAETYARIFEGDERWRSLPVPEGGGYAWDETSTYIRRPPFLEGIAAEPAAIEDVHGARALALLGDSVTTDHISPAGAIAKTGPAGRWLIEHGVEPREFNSYGSRRGNHEVMMRGTFANIRLRNRLLPGSEGGVTVHLPDGGEETSIYEAAMRYGDEGVPLVVLAGKEYGSGSSRDWAAKGTSLLGIRAVIAESFERIHRSNLIGMGVLPLQFEEGDSVESLGLTGREQFEVTGLAGAGGELPDRVTVRADGKQFSARVRIDTPAEAEYFRHGGILPYVLRQLRGA